jgi:hypothetical protein
MASMATMAAAPGRWCKRVKKPAIPDPAPRLTPLEANR